MIQERVRSTKLTRNRFLAFAGTAVVAGAVQAWFPGRAEAAPPNGCSGLNACSCCGGTSGCCVSGCTRLTICGGKHCWHACAYEGSTLISFNCCDWKHGSTSCICRENYGPC